MHTAEEINAFGQSDLKVLSDMLADKPFFFGDEPTNVSTHISLYYIGSNMLSVIFSCFSSSRLEYLVFPSSLVLVRHVSDTLAYA